MSATCSSSGRSLRRKRCGSVMDAGPIEDPIFGLIATLRETRAAIVAKEDHIAELGAAIPDEVRDWPGVLIGMWRDPTSGKDHARFLYSEVRSFHTMAQLLPHYLSMLILIFHEEFRNPPL